eukprot:scaffold118724_cov63-Phaeocystis_antarctica.AAC.7
MELNETTAETMAIHEPALTQPRSSPVAAESRASLRERAWAAAASRRAARADAASCSLACASCSLASCSALMHTNCRHEWSSMKISVSSSSVGRNRTCVRTRQ